MVLTISEEKFAKEHGEEAYDYLFEYWEKVGTRWPPYNHNLGYENIEAWYEDLKAAVDKLRAERK